MHPGDPLNYTYFRFNELLYRVGIVYGVDFELISQIEREVGHVWEVVPGTSEVHPSEKKAQARVKLLLNPVEHMPRIAMASYVPDDIDVAIFANSLPRIRGGIRFHGPERTLTDYIKGDYVIETVGVMYSVKQWNGFAANEVAPCAFTLEGACRAAAFHAEEIAREEEAARTPPDVLDYAAQIREFEEFEKLEKLRMDLQKRADDTDLVLLSDDDATKPDLFDRY